MKAIVRDDIIALDSFVAAEFKYKPYLEMLMKAGNYCFLDQFKRLMPSGQSIISGMIEKNLVATENINKNYKYIYLTDTAMKYLYLRDSGEDYSEITKNRISVKKVNKNPSEKQLLSSAYKFHFIACGEEMIVKDDILKGIEDFIFFRNHKVTSEKYTEWVKKNSESIKNYKNEIEKLNNESIGFKKSIQRINKGLEIFNSDEEIQELNELKKSYKEIQAQIDIKSNSTFKLGVKELSEQLSNMQALIRQVEKRLDIKKCVIKNYKDSIAEIESVRVNKESSLNEFEKNFDLIVKSVEEKTIPKINEIKKVFENLYNISKVIARIDENILIFIILDTGNFKTAFEYLKQVNNIGSLGIGYENVKIIICSYAENRAENLYNEFIKAKKDKEKALNTIKVYNQKTNNSATKSDFYIAAEKICNNTPEFDIEIKRDFYYMKSYKEIISSSTKSIKRKDRKAVDDLIIKLKNN